MISGSIGLLPSASLREDKFGMYEPIHGSAPDIQGQGKANPIATILSLAMMFRYTFNHEECAKTIEKAIENTLKKGYGTLDIIQKNKRLINTEEMGDLISNEIRGMNL